LYITFNPNSNIAAPEKNKQAPMTPNRTARPGRGLWGNKRRWKATEMHPLAKRPKQRFEFIRLRQSLVHFGL